MTILDVIDKAQAALTAAGIPNETDIEADLTTYLAAPAVEEPPAHFRQVVVIDPDTTDLDSSAQGTVTHQGHALTFTCLVVAQDKSWRTYKEEALTLAKDTLDALAGAHDVEIQATKMAYVEMMVGSLKCSGVNIETTAETK